MRCSKAYDWASLRPRGNFRAKERLLAHAEPPSGRCFDALAGRNERARAAANTTALSTLDFALVMPMERDARAACMLMECRHINAVLPAFIIIIVADTLTTHQHSFCHAVPQAYSARSESRLREYAR